MQLWMGTHPSAPSVVTDTSSRKEVYNQTPLLSLLQETPEYVGTIGVIRRFGQDLPFLFKVLSIAEPLSVQTHPDKSLAERLHAESPDKYPDDNHKPEMAIDISPFDALCSFRPHREVEKFFKLVPELVRVVGKEAADAFSTCTEAQKKDELKKCFGNLMKADPQLVASSLREFADRIKTSGFEEDVTRRAFARLYKYYPGDVGCFCLFFLNYLELQPGEALFLGANEPHCYISGDCVECMAKSDNVIRAGLTPKFKDVPRLLSSLTYDSRLVSQVFVRPVRVDKITKTFRPPVEEFAVDELHVDASAQFPMRYTLPARDSGSILIILSGKMLVGERTLSAGSVFFVPAMLAIPVVLLQSELLCYRAYACLKS